METIKKGLKILSLEAKDIYLSNLNDPFHGYEIKYKSGEKAGQFLEKKFCNTLDFSLELIELKNLYHKKISKKNFTVEVNQFPATLQVINRTYHYALKEFNPFGQNRYVKLGSHLEDLEFEDSVCIKNGQLIGIIINENVKHPISEKLLGKCFKIKDGKYQAANIPTVMTTAMLREWTYSQGFVVNKTHYCRYKRSSGSSRVGKCLFINTSLYPHIHKWELCGLKVNEKTKADLAAWEAYISLPLSSIIDTIKTSAVSAHAMASVRIARP